MIEIEHLNKTYPSPGGDIHALRDVNLRIEDGEIFGIIGLSGAGKSTLVRCINLLERPTSGTVRIDGRDMTQLSRRDLLKARQDIGMIFQSFNLLEQRTVLRNICFPLEIAGVKANTIAMRGGTDGSYLSVKGILTPNYFTGAHNFHSNCEFLPMKSWEKSLEVTLAIIDLTAKNARG